MSNNILIYDTECFKNYFLIMFKRFDTQEYLSFESFEGSDLDENSLVDLIKSNILVGFECINYDTPMIESFLSGHDPYQISSKIIGGGLKYWQTRDKFKYKSLISNQIDLIDVAPSMASLKMYGARMGAVKLQDLPLDPHTNIKKSQIEEIKKYCINDLVTTEMLYKKLLPDLKLRSDMSKKYGMDLRSKSDAQIAEAVIKKSVEDGFGKKLYKPNLDLTKVYYYKKPDYINFKSETLNKVLSEYQSSHVTLSKSGKPSFEFEIQESDRRKNGKLPKDKKKLKFKFYNSVYTVGSGGLHSCEKNVSYGSDGYVLKCFDVDSYYPNLILNNELCPNNIGVCFLDVYSGLVNKRLAAKKQKDTKTSASLKIVINGSYGKFGSPYSVLYAPDLLTQVTITGQLSLLMLIEQFEMSDIKVVSANTDGVVVRYKPEQNELVKFLVADWESTTDLTLGESEYKSIHSRDVNNYIAVKSDGCEGKGDYADQSSDFNELRKNPRYGISVEAVKKYLQFGTPVEKTILDCKEITKFLTATKVKGGAVKCGEYLGKTVRWYYGKHELEAIHYKETGNKVAMSDGAVPAMDLPKKIPNDLDYQWYIDKSKEILKGLGVN